MIRTSTRHAALALAAFVIAAASLAAQPKRAATDIDQYRKYYLPQGQGEPKDGAVRVTFLGTTTLLLDDGETQIMTDGFFSRPPLLQIARGKLETSTRIVDAVLKKAGVERLKALFVAHSHYDHAFDAATVAQKTGARLYGSASTLNIGRGGGLRDEQMTLFEPGKEVTIGRFTVTVLKSKHSPPIRGINDDLGQTIDKPLKQPAAVRDYKEGGSFDFLIRHQKGTILVSPSSNYAEGALDRVRADVLFLGTGSLGNQTRAFQDAYYDHTVGKIQPKLVIPIHWDNFFRPLDDHLEPLARPLDDAPAAFDFLLKRLQADKIAFGIMQGYQSVMLFGKDGLPGKKGK